MYNSTDKKNRIHKLLYTTKASIKEQFVYDDVGVISMTHFAISEDICARIRAICSELGISEPRILDAFACIGGNTIPFCANFADVTAIELNASRFRMLLHNLGLFYDMSASARISVNELIIEGSGKIRVLCCDTTMHVGEHYDVIFVDPPWNGNVITISEKTISEYIASQRASLYVLKVPHDYDLGEFSTYNITYEIYDLPNRMKIAYLAPAVIFNAS